MNANKDPGSIILTIMSVSTLSERSVYSYG